MYFKVGMRNLFLFDTHNQTFLNKLHLATKIVQYVMYRTKEC